MYRKILTLFTLTLLRVPLVIRGPGIPSDESRTELVLNNDLAPTIAKLAQVETPTVDGRSLTPLFFGNVAPTVPDRVQAHSPTGREQDGGANL